MKNIALAGLFATALAAQQHTAPELELAAVIAVEEQEHDLAKAQRLYEAAIDDASLSQAARALAKQRLERLQRRLGRVADTQGQDAERSRQLRQRARELLEDRKSWPQRQPSKWLQGVPKAIGDQLLWIGEPAVPEVVAVLREELDQPYGGDIGKVPGLLMFLWQVGGPAAERFLADCAGNRNVAALVAGRAYAMRSIDVHSPAVRAYLEAKDWQVTRNFLTGGPQPVLTDRLDNEQVVAIAERGGPQLRALMLSRANARRFDKGQLARMHRMVRAALAGTQPDLGRAAELFLAGTSSQQSFEGLLIVLERLPDLRRRSVPIGPRSFPKTSVNPVELLTGEQLAQLTSAVDSCLKKIGPVEGHRAKDAWIYSLLNMLVEHDPANVRPRVLDWWDLGYEMYRLIPRASAITTDNAMQYLARFDRVDGRRRDDFLGMFSGVEMPREALPRLIEIGGQVQGRDLYPQLAAMMATTGAPEVAGWIVQRWREARTAQGESGPSRRRPRRDWCVDSMLELARRQTSQPVRTAMLDLVRGFGGKQPEPKDRARLMLALMAMGDERVLDFVVEGVSGSPVPHPFAERDSSAYSPLNYLIYQGVEPAHPYSAQQVLGVVERWLNKRIGKGWTDPGRMATSRIPDDVLVLFATIDKHNYDSGSWQAIAMNRLHKRIEAGGELSAMDAWFRSVIGNAEFVGAASHMRDTVLRRYRTELMALVDGPDEDWAYRVVRDLDNLDGSIDVAAMLKSRFRELRRWAIDCVRDGRFDLPVEQVLPLLRDSDYDVRWIAAQHLGAKVSKQAVPGLIRLLRDDSEHVRDAASQALTRIRFYHEQQAHWERVLKGVDASPGSAAEKLLVQAKPGANKQQRLLAITSLGVLGAPEALPFLIEWSQDQDAEIAKAARSAITKIHLKPGK